MLFSAALFPAVMSGRKTQTRRLALPSDWFAGRTSLLDGHSAGLARSLPIHDVQFVRRRTRMLYAVGWSYAVQPGRGKRSAGRLTLASISLERVLGISDADVAAEGFLFREDFLATWDVLHPDHPSSSDPAVWALAWRPPIMLATTEERIMSLVRQARSMP